MRRRERGNPWFETNKKNKNKRKAAFRRHCDWDWEEKSVDKLADWSETLTSCSGSLSHEELRSLVGLLMWSARILQHQLAPYYYLLRYVRESARAVHNGGRVLDQRHQLWGAAWEQLRALHAFCLANTPVHHTEVPDVCEFTLFTDASPSGWGCCLIRPDGTMSGHGAPWAPADRGRHINELELVAIARSLLHFKSELHDTTVELRVDNTTALAVHRKGHSASFALNQDGQRLQHVVRRQHLRVAAEYVRSEENRADYFSRIFG